MTIPSSIASLRDTSSPSLRQGLAPIRADSGYADSIFHEALMHRFPDLEADTLWVTLKSALVRPITHNNGRTGYELRLLGALLAKNGEKTEKQILGWLAWAYGKFIKDQGLRELDSKEFQTASGLSNEDLHRLGELIHGNHLAPGFNLVYHPERARDSHWRSGPPPDIHKLSSEAARRSWLHDLVLPKPPAPPVVRLPAERQLELLGEDELARVSLPDMQVWFARHLNKSIMEKETNEPDPRDTLTNRRLKRLTGLTTQTIEHWRSGSHLPGRQPDLEKLVKALPSLRLVADVYLKWRGLIKE